MNKFSTLICKDSFHQLGFFMIHRGVWQISRKKRGVWQIHRSLKLKFTASENLFCTGVSLAVYKVKNCHIYPIWTRLQEKFQQIYSIHNEVRCISACSIYKATPCLLLTYYVHVLMKSHACKYSTYETYWSPYRHTLVSLLDTQYVSATFQARNKL